MNNFKQPGDVLTLTAPVGGVVGGTAYKIGQLLVVAAASADAGDPFEGKVTGVFSLPKNAGDTPGEGALVYWDDGAGDITTTPNSNLLVGVAVKEAAGGDATVDVRLDGVARPDEAA